MRPLVKGEHESILFIKGLEGLGTCPLVDMIIICYFGTRMVCEGQDLLIRIFCVLLGNIFEDLVLLIQSLRELQDCDLIGGRLGDVIPSPTQKPTF